MKYTDYKVGLINELNLEYESMHFWTLKAAKRWARESDASRVYIVDTINDCKPVQEYWVKNERLYTKEA
jgi:hypothetical protein